VTLEDGREIIGQHRMTGKEQKPLTSPIQQLFLSADAEYRQPVEVALRKKNRKLIHNAELVCYPPGSFYSSLVANLLPKGVADAIASNRSPKVYIPNLEQDPEQLGMTMDSSIQTLLRYLHQGGGKKYNNGDFLNFVLLDSGHGSYLDRPSAALMEELGIQQIETKLVSKSSAPYYDSRRLASALLSLT
jgi:CofD-related protein of GAK system